MAYPRVAGVPHGGLSPGFLAVLDEILPIGGDALDLGTGTGRVALLVAPRARRVVGVDVDAGALEAARLLAGRQRTTNASFVQGDAEKIGLLALNDGRGFELATAHLFLSLPLVARVAAALGPGGHFVVSAFASDHWKEAGGSRFNLPIERVETTLRELGFEIRRIAIEGHEHRFADAASAQEYLKDRRLSAQWKTDGRWAKWRSAIGLGEATLTESRMLVWAQDRRAATGGVPHPLSGTA